VQHQGKLVGARAAREVLRADDLGQPPPDRPQQRVTRLQAGRM